MRDTFRSDERPGIRIRMVRYKEKRVRCNASAWLSVTWTYGTQACTTSRGAATNRGSTTSKGTANEKCANTDRLQRADARQTASLNTESEVYDSACSVMHWKGHLEVNIIIVFLLQTQGPWTLAPTRRSALLRYKYIYSSSAEKTVTLRTTNCRSPQKHRKAKTPTLRLWKWGRQTSNRPNL